MIVFLFNILPGATPWGDSNDIESNLTMILPNHEQKGVQLSDLIAFHKITERIARAV